jgi:hypothetical protein
MEISRLPLTSAGRPASTTYTGTTRAAETEAVAAVSSRPRARSSEQVERVVQGELLQRERTFYQSTRAFINERDFDQALSDSGRANVAPRSRAAISLYLNNARPEAVASLAQGQSINYFA